MTALHTFTRAGLALAFALSLAGCGQGALVGGPALKGAQGALRAKADAPAMKAKLLADFSTAPEDVTIDAPQSGHPFAEPTRFYVHDGVLHAISANNDRPRRGFYLVDVDERAGSFDRDYDKNAELEPEKQKPNLSKVVRLNFNWATSTAAPSATSMFSAMAVFVVERRVDAKTTTLQALAYAWSTGDVESGVYPAVTKPALRLNYGGDENGSVPLRIIPVQKGPGLGKAVDDASFRQMLQNRVSQERSSFVSDFYAAFPNGREGLMDGTEALGSDVNSLQMPLSALPSSPLADVPTGGAVVAPTAPVSTNQGDLLGIRAVGFGADIQGGVASHALLDDVSVSLFKDK